MVTAVTVTVYDIFSLMLSQSCGMMQPLEVVVPNGIEPFLVVALGEVGDGEDVVVSDVATFHSQFHVVTAVILPSPAEMTHRRFFYYLGSAFFMMPPGHSPCEFQQVVSSVHIVCNPLSQTFGLTYQWPYYFG